MSSQSILIGCVQRHDEASDTTAHAPYKPITAVVKNVLVYTAGWATTLKWMDLDSGGLGSVLQAINHFMCNFTVSPLRSFSVLHRCFIPLRCLAWHTVSWVIVHHPLLPITYIQMTQTFDFTSCSAASAISEPFWPEHVGAAWLCTVLWKLSVSACRFVLLLPNLPRQPLGSIREAAFNAHWEACLDPSHWQEQKKKGTRSCKKENEGKELEGWDQYRFFFFFNHRLTDCYLKRSKAESDV